MNLFYLILLTFVIWNALQYADKNVDKIKAWLMGIKFRKRLDDCQCEMCRSQDRNWEFEDLKKSKNP